MEDNITQNGSGRCC